MNDISTCTDIATAVRNGSASATHVIRRALDDIERFDPKLFAVRETQAQSALEHGARLDERAQRQDLPLCGVPVLIKDNIAQAKVALRAGRPDQARQIADEDAVVVQRLRAAGAVIVGRANMDELAYGVTGSNEHTGQVRNPWDTERHPGGSSAGPGAAVAAGMVPVSLGTDTGGSVRIPASVCGLVGMRPSRGLVSTEGVAPLSRSLDTVGPLATTVGDVALVLSVLSGRNELAQLPASSEASLRDRTLVALTGTFALDVDDAIARVFDAAQQTLRKAGATVNPTRLPQLRQGPRASGPIIGSEASYAWAEQLSEHPTWFGKQVAELVEKGTGIKAVRLLRAQDEALQVVEAVDALFERGTWALVLPTVAKTTKRVDELGSQLEMLTLTAPFSLGGWPSISVPMGQIDGMPIGLQIVGPRGQDQRVLAIAAEFERRQPWPRTAPPVV